MRPKALAKYTTHALSLLEAIVYHDTLATLSSVPTDLSINKRALVRSKQLLGYPQCSSISQLRDVVDLLCQQIIASYENIIAKLCEQFSKANPDNLFAVRGDGVDQLRARIRGRIQEQKFSDGEALNGLTPDKRLLFKDYEVDVEEEPCVFGGLTSMQLKTLVLFLARLWGLARGWGWGRMH